MTNSAIPAQVYSGMWIKLPHDVKSRIAQAFNIKQNGPTHVINNEVASDGYLDRDLAAINVESLQEKTGLKSSDIFQLWNHYVQSVTEEIAKENAPKPLPPKKPEVNVNVNVHVDNEGNAKVAEPTKNRHGKRSAPKE